MTSLNIGYNRRTMLKVTICHEKGFVRTTLWKYCADYFHGRGINFQIQEYTSGESMLKGDFPDILFLGMQAGNLDGVLIKEVLQKMKASTRILFVSETKERICSAFGKNVYGFLLEPLSDAVLLKKLNEMIMDYLEDTRTIYCRCGKRMERIFLLDVLYVKAYGRYTKIYLRGKNDYVLCDKCLGDWILEEENQEFIWCHRSYLVNLLHIYQFGKQYVELENGTHIPLGQEHREECIRNYQKFVGRMAMYDYGNGTIYYDFASEL